jgi:hypothetical protein
MVIDPVQLLKRLNPAVRPAGAPQRDQRPGALFEQRSFGEMLTLVADGAVRSGREIALAPQAELAEPLTDDQLKRLSGAADQAEAAGARSAVMLIDGRGLIVDVAERNVERELNEDSAADVITIDAAVYVSANSQRGGVLIDPANLAAGNPQPPLTGGGAPIADDSEKEPARRAG